MREMSHQAAELVMAGREAYRPTDADRARVFAAVMGAAPLAGAAAVVSISKVSMTGLSHVIRGSRVAQVLAVAMPVAAASGAVWYATAHHPVTRSMPAPLTPREAPVSAPAALPRA